MIEIKPSILKKTKQILKKTLQDRKERAILICQDDGEQFVDKEIIGTGMNTYYPKGWNICSRGETVGHIHTHVNYPAFSFQDLAFAGAFFKKFGQSAVCVAYPKNRTYTNIECIVNKSTKEKAQKEYNLQKAEEDKLKRESRIEPGFPTEINYLNRLDIKKVNYH